MSKKENPFINPSKQKFQPFQLLDKMPKNPSIDIFKMPPLPIQKNVVRLQIPSKMFPQNQNISNLPFRTVEQQNSKQSSSSKGRSISRSDVQNSEKTGKKLNLTVKFSSNAAKVSFKKQIQLFSEINKQNVKLDLLDRNQSIKKNIGTFERILKYLNQIHKFIKGNNSQIFLSLQDLQMRRLSNEDIKTDQISRLTKGLSYYDKSQNQVISFLQTVFQHTNIGKYIWEVSRSLNLDCLKSYYLIREVVLERKRQKNRTESFLLDSNEVKLIKTNEIVASASSILYKDKHLLLDCYLFLIRSNFRSRRFIFCKHEDQILVLWLNIKKISKEPEDIQIKLLEVFKLMYQSISKEGNQQLLKEFIIMKNYIKSVTNSERVKRQINDLSIEDMLQAGKFQRQDITGHNLAIYRIFVARQSQPFQSQFTSIDSVSQISKNWIPYIQKYVKQFEFQKDDECKSKIQRSAFIYHVLIKFNDKRLIISEYLQQILIKKLFNFGSIVISMSMAQICTSKHVKIWIIKALSSLAEESFVQIQKQQMSIISKLISSAHFQKGLCAVYLSFANKFYEEYIKERNIEGLQDEMSATKTSTFYDIKVNSVVLHYIVFYVKLLKKLPSRQRQIISKINEYLIESSKQGIKLSATLTFYNNNMIRTLDSFQQICNHLLFYISTCERTDKHIEQINFWVQKITQEVISVNFSTFLDLLHLLLNNVLDTNEERFCNFFNQLVEHFSEELTETIASYRLQFKQWQKIVLILYKWKKLLQLRIISAGQIQQKQKRLFLYLMGRVSQKADEIANIFVSGMSSLDTNIKISVLNYMMGKAELFNNKKQSFQNELRSESVTIISNSQFSQMYSQLLSKFCKDFEPLQIFQSLMSFSYVNRLQFNYLVRQNSVKIKDIVLKSELKTVLDIHRIVCFAMNIYENIGSLETSYESKKINGFLVKIILIRVSQSIANCSITSTIFGNLLTILIDSLNCLQYSIHIKFLLFGLRMKLLYTNPYNQSQFSRYVLYLLCLHLAKSSNKIDLSNNQQRFKIQSELNIFTQLSKKVLGYFHSKQTHHYFNQQSRKYMGKLINVLQNSTSQQYLSNLSLGLLKKIQSYLNDALVFDHKNLFLKSLQENINRFFKKHESSQLVTLHASLNITKCEDECNYQETMELGFKYVENQKKPENLVKIIHRLNKFISNNKIWKSNIFYLSQSILQKLKNSQNEYLYLEFILLSLKSIKTSLFYNSSNTKYYHRIVNYVLQFLNIDSTLKSYVLAKQSLRILNFILKNSLLSTILVHSIISENIQLFFEKFISCINISDDQTDDVYKQKFTKIKVKLQNQLVNSSRYQFSYWNLIQYHEKQAILFEILEIYRQFNGLLQFQPKKAAERISYFIMFSKEEIQGFRFFEKKDCCDVINKICKQHRGSLKSIVNHLDNPLNLGIIQKRNRMIVQTILSLDVQLTKSEVYEEELGKSIKIQ